MLELLRRNNLIISCFLLIVASFQLMSASINDPTLPQYGGKVIAALTSPIEFAYHGFVKSVTGVWEKYLWLVNIADERDDLLQQLKQLEAQNSRLIEFSHENERLRSLLQFQEDSLTEGITAAVIGRDPSNWIRTITVGAGSRDGISATLPVVDGHAVVGQTTAVADKSSRILLLIDSTSAIDALVQNSRAPGIVEGSTEGLLIMRYVLKDYEVKPGDRVITTGLDSVYPKGLLIGVVSEVERNVSGLFQHIIIEPRVDFNRLETVLILTSSMADKKSD